MVSLQVARFNPAKNPPRGRFGIGGGLCIVLLALTLSTAGSRADAPAGASPESTMPEFLFRDLPRPVLFFGDDATAQRMYSTLIETYTVSRFPTWKITFRNTGWAGDKLLSIGIRGYSRDQDIRRDIESYRPQMALVNYGINDARGGDAAYPGFLTSVNILARDLPRVGVNRTAFISPNPEEGYVAGAPAGSPDNLMLQKYAEGMSERLPFGWKDGVTAVLAHPKSADLPRLQDAIFIDLLNPMIALIEAGRKAGVLSSDDSLGDKTVRLTTDGIHPNWGGQFIMAALILQGLHAPDLVSSATLDGGSRSTTSAQGCAITWQDAPPGTIQFLRQDDALPWPTPTDVDFVRKIPGFDPATSLNRYELQVTGLKDASYRLSIDAQEMGIFSQAELSQGINLGPVRKGPIYDRGQKLLKAVLDKNDTFFHRWREVQLGAPPAPGTSAGDIRKEEAAHAAEVKSELARLDKVIADDQVAIQALAQPLPHVFKLEPVIR